MDGVEPRHFEAFKNIIWKMKEMKKIDHGDICLNSPNSEFSDEPNEGDWGHCQDDKPEGNEQSPIWIGDHVVVGLNEWDLFILNGANYLKKNSFGPSRNHMPNIWAHL